MGTDEPGVRRAGPQASDFLGPPAGARLLRAARKVSARIYQGLGRAAPVTCKDSAQKEEQGEEQARRPHGCRRRSSAALQRQTRLPSRPGAPGAVAGLVWGPGALRPSLGMFGDSVCPTHTPWPPGGNRGPCSVGAQFGPGERAKWETRAAAPPAAHQSARPALPGLGYGKAARPVSGHTCRGALPGFTGH